MRPVPEAKLFVLHAARPDLDDASLARAAARGEDAAAGLIWDRYSGVVRGVVRRSLGRKDVEDHVQEVFLRFFRHVSTLRDPSSLRCFLIGIALRVAGSELRRRRVRRFLTLTPTGELTGAVTPPLDAEAREAVVRFYALLDRLDTDSRLLFTMRHVETLELTELAEVFGVSLATIKRRLGRVQNRVFAMASGDERLLEYVSNGARASKVGFP